MKAPAALALFAISESGRSFPTKLRPSPAQLIDSVHLRTKTPCAGKRPVLQQHLPIRVYRTGLPRRSPLEKLLTNVSRTCLQTTRRISNWLETENEKCLERNSEF